MTKPTFLGIGAPKAGTTWLHNLLASHPEVWMPSKRKEVYYFNREYTRGPEWYSQFFPEEENKYRQIGEITPSYLYHPEAPYRIKDFGISKCIVLLRNPVERAWSHYKFFTRTQNLSETFEDFLENRPLIIEKGYYTKFIKKYFHLLGKNNILILSFEDSVKNIQLTKKKLSEFLEIDIDKFPPNAGKKTYNKGFTPKFPVLYSIAVKGGNFLRRHDLYFFENFFKEGVKKILETKKKNSAPITKEESKIKIQLYKQYEEEFEKIKYLNLIDITSWEEKRDQLYNINNQLTIK